MTTQVRNPEVEAARWERWRGHRNDALATPHGWLTLTSLQWLPSEPASLDGVPGLWWTDGDTAFVEAEASAGLTLIPADLDPAAASAHDVGVPVPVDGRLSAVLADEESLFWVQFGGEDGTQVQVELARRGGNYAIRPRDNGSPTFTGFTGVPVFDYNPDLAVTARFEPYSETREEKIATANPRVSGVHHGVGEVVFTLPESAGGVPGREYRLVAEEEKLGALVITFHDLTNGDTTDEWRKVVTAKPRPDGTVVIDFNRAINYPSAFTDFGTCPAPVAANSLEAPIHAGERKAR